MQPNDIFHIIKQLITQAESSENDLRAIAEEAIDISLTQAIRAGKETPLHDGILSLTIALKKEDREPIYAVAGDTMNSDAISPPTKNSQYNISSITKFFIMIAMMQLNEQGKLPLETKLAEYNFDETIPNQETISVDNLLMHTSGLHDKVYMPYHYKEPISSLLSDEIVYAPNKDFSYANINYVLLGYILEQITSETLVDYIDTHIIKQLGLKYTSMHDHRSIPKNITQGFTYNRELQKLENKSDYLKWSASNMHSNAIDLCHLLEHFFCDESLLQQDTMMRIIDTIRAVDFTVRRRHTTRTRPAHIGYTIEAYNLQDQWLFGSFGWQHSHACCMLHHPEKHYSIAVTCAKTQGLGSR